MSESPLAPDAHGMSGALPSLPGAADALKVPAFDQPTLPALPTPTMPTPPMPSPPVPGPDAPQLIATPALTGSMYSELPSDGAPLLVAAADTLTVAPPAPAVMPPLVDLSITGASPPATPIHVPAPPALPLLGGPTIPAPPPPNSVPMSAPPAIPSPATMSSVPTLVPPATPAPAPPAPPAPLAPQAPPVSGPTLAPTPPPMQGLAHAVQTSAATDAAPGLRTPAPSSSKRRSPLRVIVPLALVAGLAAVGYAGYQSMSAGSENDTDVATTLAADPTGPADAPEASSPLVAPINDSKDVVDDINDNASENEALEILESGPRGEAPVTAVPFEAPVDPGIGGTVDMVEGDIIDDDLASVIGAPAFSYRFQRGSDTAAQTVFVDATTGNRELFDGTTFVRSINGQVFVTNDPAGDWANDAAAQPTDPMLLVSSLITIADVLPEGFADLATVATITDETGYGRYAFTETDLTRLPADVRANWMASFGLDPDQPATPADAFLDEVPDQARTGEIVISISGSSDGTITRLVIDAPSLGPVVSYELLGASMQPVDIPTPMVTAG